jgi:hypothetical protein
LAKCVEAGRAAVATYAEAFSSYEFAMQRLNMDDAYAWEILGSVLSRGIGLNHSSKVADTLKYLTDSTEALAKALDLLESGEIAKAAKAAAAQAAKQRPRY